LYLAEVLSQLDESRPVRKRNFRIIFPGLNDYIRLELAYIALFSQRKIIE
jgi:hypothetical protein